MLKNVNFLTHIGVSTKCLRHLGEINNEINYQTTKKNRIMKNLKWLVFGLVATMLFTTSCDFSDDDGLFNCERGEGPIVTEDLPVDEFRSVELDIDADVFITQGPNFSVTVEGQQNIINELDLDVDGNTWHICFEDCVRNHDDLDIFITMPTIDRLAIDGSGSITGDNFFDVDDIELDISGSGDIDLGLSADDIDAKISGSGKMILEGDADKLDFKISGSGDLRAFDLVVRKADIVISGSGDAEVNVTDDLDIKISGSGDVYYKGQPSIKIDVTGSGDVISVD